MRLDSTVPDFEAFVVNVTSTPLLLTPKSGEPPKLFWRIKAADAMEVRSIGSAAYPLAAGEEVELPVHGTIYLVAGSPTTARILKV